MVKVQSKDHFECVNGAWTEDDLLIVQTLVIPDVLRQPIYCHKACVLCIHDGGVYNCWTIDQYGSL